MEGYLYLWGTGDVGGVGRRRWLIGLFCTGDNGVYLGLGRLGGGAVVMMGAAWLGRGELLGHGGDRA